MGSKAEQKFNDDLLLSEADRALARIKFPHLFQFLDFAELREAFSKHDVPANALKKKRRRSGLAAIAMGVAALAGAASSPLLNHESLWPLLVGFASSLLGFSSIVVGGLGVFSAKSRDAWLHHRLITERLRQLHFQLLVARMPQVLAAVEDPTTLDAFVAERRGSLAAFAMAYEGHETSKLKGVLDDSDEAEFPLVPLKVAPDVRAKPETLQSFFDAYGLLRFEHQIQYANWMLRRETTLLPSSAAGQFRLLRAASLTAMTLIFCLHLVLAVSLIVKGASPGHLLDASIIWLAILMMAARAFEEGVQPGREIERYSNYRAVLKRLQRLFEAAEDVQEKHRLMIETERTVYQEMRAFLLLHEDARFVL